MEETEGDGGEEEAMKGGIEVGAGAEEVTLVETEEETRAIIRETKGTMKTKGGAIRTPETGTRRTGIRGKAAGKKMGSPKAYGMLRKKRKSQASTTRGGRATG